MTKKLQMPPRIPDTPENIALACMQGPPKKEWEFMKKAKAERQQKGRKSAKRADSRGG